MSKIKNLLELSHITRLNNTEKKVVFTKIQSTYGLRYDGFVFEPPAEEPEEDVHSVIRAFFQRLTNGDVISSIEFIYENDIPEDAESDLISAHKMAEIAIGSKFAEDDGDIKGLQDLYRFDKEKDAIVFRVLCSINFSLHVFRLVIPLDFFMTFFKEFESDRILESARNDEDCLNGLALSVIPSIEEGFENVRHRFLRNDEKTPEGIEEVEKIF